MPITKSMLQFLLVAILALVRSQVPDALALHISVPNDVIAIQDAIDMVGVGDSVLIAPGTYTGPRNKNLDFFGKDICLIGIAGPESTIIDCEQSGRGMHFDNGETRAALVQGVTIQNGYMPDDRGGGILCYSNPTFRSIIIRNNRAQHSGGVSISYQGSPFFEDVRIEANEAINHANAGGITIAYNSQTTIQNSVICDNIGGDGAGLYISGSNITLSNILFYNNHGTSNGGAVYITGGTVLLGGCVFNANSAQFHGGGLRAGASTVCMEDCIFTNNISYQGGGAIALAWDEGSILRDCVIVHNTGAWGGGIYLDEYSAAPPTQFLQITIANNHALGGIGGGVCADWQSEALFANCLIADNGGTGMWSGNGALIDAICSNVYGNAGGNYGGNLSDQTGQDGNISADPMFCDAEANIFELMHGSPCLPENNSCSVLMGALGEGCAMTAVVDESLPLALHAHNIPNPFNSATCIRFSLLSPAAVSLEIFDLSGRLVRQLLVEEQRLAGEHSVFWRGDDDLGRRQPSGVYLYRLSTPEGQLAGKMTLVE